MELHPTSQKAPIARSDMRARTEKERYAGFRIVTPANLSDATSFKAVELHNNETGDL